MAITAATNHCITPVIFIVFNRPAQTRSTFAAIAAARPQKLLIVADGPRAGRPGEVERCREVLSIIEMGVDWECDIMWNISPQNLGCGIRVSSGITWAFEQVEEAIILEDDCLPSPDFFTFCSNMLAHYRDDKRIMHIAGTNLQPQENRTEDTYYYSRFPQIWGWATWARAWKFYSLRLPEWNAKSDEFWLCNILIKPESVRYWKQAFDSAVHWNVDTWDNQWFYAVWSQNGLAVMPNANLISNLGFGEDATHTGNRNSPWACHPHQELRLPLIHPVAPIPNRKADLFIETKVFCFPHWSAYLRKFLSPYIKRPYLFFKSLIGR